MTQHAQGLSRLAFGAAAGFAGTLAIQAFMTANQKWFPSAAPPIRQDLGEFMVESVEAALPVAVRKRIPEAKVQRVYRVFGVLRVYRKRLSRTKELRRLRVSSLTDY
jgi:hypothetical protein